MLKRPKQGIFNMVSFGILETSLDVNTFAISGHTGVGCVVLILGNRPSSNPVPRPLSQARSCPMEPIPEGPGPAQTPASGPAPGPESPAQPLVSIKDEAQLELGEDTPWSEDEAEDAEQDAGPVGTRRSQRMRLKRRRLHQPDEHICIFCHETCPNGTQLDTHYQEQHAQALEELKVFICRYCSPPQSQATAAERLEHVHSTHANALLCPVCQRADWPEGEPDLDRHLALAHDEATDRPCRFCDKTFKSMPQWRSHLRASHPKFEYQCPEDACAGQRFLTRTTYQEHVRLVHMKLKPFHCSLCDKQFTREKLLRAHVKNAHLKMTQPVCTQCSYHPKSTRDLKQHMEAKHETLVDIWKCNLCRYDSISKVTLTRHKNSAHVQCDLCEDHFRSLDELEEHTLFLHPDSLMCTLCHTRNASQKQLKAHMALHYRDSLFSCHKCEFEAATISDLNEHILRMHLLDAAQADEVVKVYNPDTQELEDASEAIFRCFECDFWAPEIRVLVHHVQFTHFREGKKMFPCEDCDYVAKTPFTLRDHKKRCGKGTRKYKCQLCDYESNHFNGLIQHSQEVHKRNKNKRMKCPHCEFTTERAYNLKVHMRKHNRPATGGAPVRRPRSSPNHSEAPAPANQAHLSNKENEEG